MAHALLLIAGIATLAAPLADREAVAQLDRTYQEAVKRNDAEAMKEIMHPDFLLVLGDGRRFGREDLLNDARQRRFIYELQDEAPNSQSVIVWGDTAIVTAKLLMKGTVEGKPFDRVLWFSDTYVRTDSGWKYLFGQASLPLPAEKEAKQTGSTGGPENPLALKFWPKGSV
jgi:ketosteroid isomerase-like protein